MTRLLRVWIPGGLLGLLGSAGVFANNPLGKVCPPAACPAPLAPCPTPGAKIVVEMSPPEVTFKQAAPACVRAPAPHNPSMHCYPVTAPGPMVPSYAPPAYAPPPMYAYAPAPMYAPAYPPPMYAPPVAYAPAPMYAPAPAPMYAPPPAYAPIYAPPPVAYAPAPAPAPVAPPPAFGLMPAPCGSQSGFGPQAGLTSAEDLAAMVEGRLAYERAVLRRQYAATREQLSGLEKQAASYGLAPSAQGGLAPKDEKTAQNAPSDKPPAAAPAPVDPVIKEIRDLKQHIDNLYKLANHQLEEMEKLKAEHEKPRKGPLPIPKE